MDRKLKQLYRIPYTNEELKNSRSVIYATCRVGTEINERISKTGHLFNAIKNIPE